MDAMTSRQVCRQPSHRGVHGIDDWGRKLESLPEALADCLCQAVRCKGHCILVAFQLGHLARAQNSLQLWKALLASKRVFGCVHKSKSPVHQPSGQVLILRCNPACSSFFAISMVLLGLKVYVHHFIRRQIGPILPARSWSSPSAILAMSFAPQMMWSHTFLPAELQISKQQGNPDETENCNDAFPISRSDENRQMIF